MMKNLVMKNLIILGAIIFSFALTTGASAYYNPYDSANWLVPTGSVQAYDYNPGAAYNAQYYGYYNPVMSASSYNNSAQQYGYYQQQVGYTTPEPVQPKTSIVNNYYQTVPAAAVVRAPVPTTVTYGTPTNTYPVYNGANTNAPVGYNNTGYSNTGYNNTGYTGSNTNALGASAYNGYNNSYNNGYNQSPTSKITALSLKGSGGFMPSSIWQWIFVIILILIIIIVARTIMKKPAMTQESHSSHSH